MISKRPSMLRPKKTASENICGPPVDDFDVPVNAKTKKKTASENICGPPVNDFDVPVNAKTKKRETTSIEETVEPNLQSETEGLVNCPPVKHSCVAR